MIVCKMVRTFTPRLRAVARISLLVLIFAFAWMGTNTNEISASESDYEYRDITGGVEITKYVGSAKDVTIPDTLGGKPVIRIGRDAFYNQQLTSVIMPDSVLEIGLEAFGRNHLTSVTIPNSVVKIENYAFDENQLTFVELGSQVAEINGSAFYGNPLATIRVDQDNMYFKDIDENGLYTVDGTVLVVGTISGEIATDTLEIGDYALSGRGLTSIHIPNQIEKIGQSSFYNNELIRLVIPASVKQISSRAFRHNLLEEMHLGEHVEEIDGYAFANNRLTSIEITDSVTTVGYGAFGYNLLTDVKIGASVQTLEFDGSLFLGNPIENIELASGNANFQVVADGKALYSLDLKTLIIGTTSGVILEGTKTIGGFAFDGRNLKSISIPDSVRTIDRYAFFNNQLTQVTIPDGVTHISSAWAFDNNPYLVLSGTCGKEAESFAQDNDIPFLSNCEPLVIQFEPNGSHGIEVNKATTKVTIYSYDELETEQYYIWTLDKTSPAFDETTWTAFTSEQELSITDEGDWYLHIYAKDVNGFLRNRSSQVFLVDYYPEIHISALVGDAGAPYLEGEWVDQQVHVNIRAEDMNMRDMHIKVRHDGDEEVWTVGTEHSFTFQRTFSKSGIYQLEIQATDEAGQTTTETYTIKISMDGLRLDVTLKQADSTDLVGQWTNQHSVTASVYAYNVYWASVTDVVYSLNEGVTWMPYLAPLTFVDEGTYFLWVQAEDEVGNSLMDQLMIGIDRTKPEIHFDPDGDTHAVRSVSSEVTVTDDLSGIDEHTLYYLWSENKDLLDVGASWSTFLQGERLNFTGTSGEWYLHIRAQDRAGNEQYLISQSFFVRQNTGGGGSSGGYDNGRSDYDLSNANISELDVSVGQLTPTFSEEITDYILQVDQHIEQISITVRTTQRDATIMINGERLDSVEETVQLPIVEDVERIEIVITAQDGTEKLYTLTIERDETKIDEHDPLRPLYTDITGHWAEHDIIQANAKGIISGYPDGSFKPDNPVTRAEFTVMLIHALPRGEVSAASTFTDDQHIQLWARQAIDQAVHLGIVAGYNDGSFRPDAQITRAEMAVMIARAMQLSTAHSTSISFADDEDIPHWARDAVDAIQELGIVNGRSDNKFVPNDTTTRAEAIVVQLRMLEQQ